MLKQPLFRHLPTWNGEKLDSHLISHEAIVKGGKLILEMGPTANKNWGLD